MRNHKDRNKLGDEPKTPEDLFYFSAAASLIVFFSCPEKLFNHV